MEEKLSGPKTGKPSTNNGMQIPINKAMPFVSKIAKLVVRKRKDQPKLSPRTPVVNGKINNSAGWSEVINRL